MRINDSPVCLLQRQPAEWLVCFVPPNDKRWWHKFVRSPLKHCFALKHEGNHWILFEPWWSRILISVLNETEVSVFLEWGRMGVILGVKETVPGNSSQLRGWMSCAALVAHLLGRKYKVYFPHRLMERLMREPGTRVHENIIGGTRVY